MLDPFSVIVCPFIFTELDLQSSKLKAVDMYQIIYSHSSYIDAKFTRCHGYKLCVALQHSLVMAFHLNCDLTEKVIRLCSLFYSCLNMILKTNK